MRWRSLGILIVASALALAGCDPAAISSAPSAVCTESGTQCDLGGGPLGVCERAPCPPGDPDPCFACVSQH